MQHIVVYRNPLEAAFWNAVTSPIFWWFIVSVPVLIYLRQKSIDKAVNLFGGGFEAKARVHKLRRWIDVPILAFFVIVTFKLFG